MTSNPEIQNSPNMKSLSFLSAMQQELLGALRNEGPKKRSIVSRLVGRALGIPRVLRAYREIKRIDNGDFLESCLKVLNLDYQVSEAELRRIPEKGPLLLVANHPYGGPEGLVLAAMLRRLRPDVKVMINRMFTALPEMEDFVIKVDPYAANSGESSKNLRAMRESFAWLKNGGALIVFPAGKVSEWNPRSLKVTDPEWSPRVSKLIHMAKCPVVPAFIEGCQGPLFQLAGLIHPRLRTLLIPRSIVPRKMKRLTIRLGKATPYSYLRKFDTAEKLINTLRFRTYALSQSQLPSEKTPSLNGNYGWKPVGAAQDIDAVADDVAQLPKEALMIENSEIGVYCAPAEKIPNLLQELGRLREITFRQVGEGSGEELDLDKFDYNYHHLFAWHRTNKEIIGAYRIGRTDEIVAKHGPDGLYTSSLYKFDPRVFDVITPALELGRSFVQLKYQREANSLFMLWKGIAQYICRNPKYRFMFGPVSISNDYPTLARQMMVEYLDYHHRATNVGFRIKGRKPVTTEMSQKLGFDTIVPYFDKITELNDLIADIQSDDAKVPVLLQLYLQLGAKMLAFHLDPEFSFTVTCLILVDLYDTDQRRLKMFMGKEQVQDYLVERDKLRQRIEEAS